MSARIRSSNSASARPTVAADGLAAFLSQAAKQYPDRSAFTVLCIGTDRSTGDAYGPLLGSKLVQQGWPQVIGTLEQPCDADRMPEAMADIERAGRIVIAFDACLGGVESIGKYAVLEGPISPAAATGSRLLPVGDFSVAAIVGRKSIKPMWELQSASLRMVLRMAEETAEAMNAAWPAS